MIDDMGNEMGEAIGLERALGRVEGSLKAQEDRSNRIEERFEKEISTMKAEINARFDAQDQKLDLLVAHQTKQDGATGLRRILTNGAFQVFLAALSGGVFAELSIKWFSK